MTSETDEKLEEYQKEWYQSICKPWVEKGGSCPDKMCKWTQNKYGEQANYSFSQPFFTAVGDETTKPLIMFIGQETNGWGRIDDFDVDGGKKWDIESSQKSGIDIKKKELSLPINASTFWHFIAAVVKTGKEKPIGIVWNNLDKIHYRVENATVKRRAKDVGCITLYPEDEAELNGKIEKYQKSLLLLEIETIDPDLIVFLTGPNYKKSMERALGTTVKDKPSPERTIVKINDRMLWTYHPSFLIRNGKRMNEAIDVIVGMIEKMR